jgi:iron-sulfur cluster assembly protein
VKPIFTLTDTAAQRVQRMLSSREEPTLGIRVSVRQKGCSGNAYVLEYVNEVNPYDEILEDKGVRIFIDPKAVLFIIGTEMDFVDEKFQSGFVFRNPNEKGLCGCGKSFHV